MFRKTIIYNLKELIVLLTKRSTTNFLNHKNITQAIQNMRKHHIGKSKIYVNIAEFIVKALLNRTNILPNMLDEILDIC